MRHQPAEQTFLAEIVPPRALEDGMSAARAMFAALAGASLSLEIAVTARGPRWHVRARTEAVLEQALAQLRLAYPQAAVERVPSDRPDLDPAAIVAPESAVAVELRPTIECALPIRTDWRNHRDPLAGVLTAAGVLDGERVVCRLTIAPARSTSAERIRRRYAAHEPAAERDDRRFGPSLVPFIALFAVGAVVLQAWRWYEGEDWWLLAAGGAGALVTLPLIALVAARVLRRADPIPSAVVERKLGAPLLRAQIEVRAFGDDPVRVRALAMQVAAAYCAYDDPGGGGLRPDTGRRLWRAASLELNAAELAALWHLPDDTDAPSGVRRTTAKTLPPAPGHAMRGARVGVVHANSQSPVYLPAPLLYRNQLVVAKTRRGKSTLLRHIAAALMERMASGTNDAAALVVVDPHQDLAESVLAAVPDPLVDRTVYLDFADLEQPVGLNLLDVELFRDRDRTTEHVITMLNRLWPANWGPRMEGALRASLASLLEVNTRRGRDEQYTLLDVAPFLTDARLRARLLTEVEDPALQAWWRDNYDRAGRVLQQQTANPVTSKVGRFTVTEASRLVLGQARSTFDPRTVLHDNGVLVVNTAVGALGEGAASLVGATLLNLLGLLVEEQVAVPPAQRRRVVALVDESSTLGAVDYARMLSELGKYGASFVLVTQSLAKLDAVDRNLAPTIFANSDGLTVFQVSAEDARRLTPELGSALEIEDLISLDDFVCYARWWDGRTRPAAFSLCVDPPPPPAAGRVDVIARRSALRYGRRREEVVAEITRALLEHAPESGGRGQQRASPSFPKPTDDSDPDPMSTAPTAHTDAALDADVHPPRRARGKAQRGSRRESGA